MAYLEASNLIKRFGSFTAVNDVSFCAEAGEFITLLGPSGCGKTTLLKIIGGFYELDSGQLSIAGESMKQVPPEKRNTAMCFQSYALFPHLSVFHNVAFGLVQHKVPKNQIDERVKQVLKQVDLLNQVTKFPGQLSGGQQQRVALARAMVLHPGVILFDEPLSNLDAQLRESVRFEIRKLQEEMRFTAVYVTHDQSEALALSDKILVMRKGRIEQEGNPQEIYNQPKNRFVAGFIGRANILKGCIISQNGARYQVNTELGPLEVISSNYSHNTGKKQNPTAPNIYLGWRPENIILTENMAINSSNQITVQVEQLAFLGSCTQIKARKGNSVMHLEIPQNIQMQKQETFTFSIDPKKIFFLEKCWEADSKE